MSLKQRILHDISTGMAYMSLFSMIISGVYLFWLLGKYFLTSVEWDIMMTFTFIITAVSSLMNVIFSAVYRHYDNLLNT